ncbi:MAG: hypothetical protein ABR539_11435, partial [Halomonas sp.]
MRSADDSTVSSAAVCRCQPLLAPDAKPWHKARLGPALLSRQFAVSGLWPGRAVSPSPEVLRRG